MAITNDYCDYGAGNDYIGASFTDGSFANATLTLTKAGAFTATKVNHWLYLTDNGSGEVTTGYYRVTSVAGAPDAVVLHADIRSGANDPTDVKCTQHDGTTSKPWRSLQGAFDLLTRNTTDGNKVNLKAGTAQVNAAALDLATLIAGGALSDSAPLIIRGYTSSANDGGMAEIDCGGATMFAATTYDYVMLADLDIHNGGNNNLVRLDTYACLFRCKLHKGASSPADKSLFYANASSKVIGCNCYDPGTGGAYGINLAQAGFAIGNYVNMGTAATGTGITGGTGTFIVAFNLIELGATGQAGISGGSFTSVLLLNAIHNSTAGTGIGITTGSGMSSVILDNILVGFSGAGGDGISGTNLGLVGYNAFYNCTNNNTITDQLFFDLTAGDVALAADPFTDAANGDFSLTAAGKTALRGLGWPGAYLGAHANTDGHVTIGAIQYGEAEAAGRPAFGDRTGGKY